MYNGIAADIDSNMAAVAYDIAWLHCIGAYAVANACSCAGGMREPYTEGCVYAHYETRAVSAIGKACAAPYIRVAHELAGIISNGLATSAAWRVICPAGG